jgi:hypothetical protein
MFAQRPIPPPFQFVMPFLVAAAALQMLAVQHASAQNLGAFAPLRAIFSSLG